MIRTTKTVTYLGVPAETTTVRVSTKTTSERVDAILWLADSPRHGTKQGDLQLKHHTGDARKEGYELFTETVIPNGTPDDLDTFVAANLSH